MDERVNNGGVNAGRFDDEGRADSRDDPAPPQGSEPWCPDVQAAASALQLMLRGSDLRSLTPEEEEAIAGLMEQLRKLLNLKCDGEGEP